ncbi:MAG: hypothetical protein A2341_12960 [Deltaproteobacteria bacterium RIFOXYB12_FULL_58_9]|nr:MAG: hypothetical protein A2341_12960 [Deltaproteobacteria bacterium RIFOXYB12_FULL_58_9]
MFTTILFGAVIAATALDVERIIVPDFDGHGVAADLTDAITDVVLTRLGKVTHTEVISRRDLQRLLDQETQRQLAGCVGDAECLSDIAGVLDAQRLLSGSVARVGNQTIITLTLIDTKDAKVRRRVSRTAQCEDNLARAASEATDALWSDVDPIENCVDCTEEPRWEAAVKFGNNFMTLFSDNLDVNDLGLSLDIDVGYRIWESFAVFGALGMRITSVRSAEGEVNLQVMPIDVGIRYHTPRFAEDLSAYAAMAVGLGFLRTEIKNKADFLTVFSGRAYVGIVYFLSANVGAIFEVSYELTSSTPEDVREQALNAAAIRLGLSYGF